MADSRFEHPIIDRKGVNMFSRSTLLIAAVAALSFSTTAHAQSPRGTAEGTIAGKSVTIDYGRPSLRGRDMLGKAPAGTVWRTSLDLTEVPLTWEQAGSSVEQFTIELADNGQMKMLWGTHVLKADFQAK